MSYSRAEKFFKGHDGIKLFLQTWENPKAKATVLITHGQAEHSDCYHRLINGLSKYLDLNFVAWDLRGHGKSDGQRGYAKDFNDYVEDYKLFIQQALQLDFIKNRSLFILAHSMGGLIQSCALVDRKYTQFVAQILSSPLLGLDIPIPVWKESAAELINQFLPKLTLGNEIKYEYLTHEVDIIKEYEKDTYRHGRISPAVFLGMKRESAQMQERATEITLPTFLSMSDHDPIVSTKEAVRFFESLGSTQKTLKIFDGAKHELYNDSCREDVFKSISDFCVMYLPK